MLEKAQEDVRNDDTCVFNFRTEFDVISEIKFTLQKPAKCLPSLSSNLCVLGINFHLTAL